MAPLGIAVNGRSGHFVERLEDFGILSRSLLISAVADPQLFLGVFLSCACGSFDETWGRDGTPQVVVGEDHPPPFGKTGLINPSYAVHLYPATT